MGNFPAVPGQDQTALEQASERFGVERQYWDIFGKLHQASDSVQSAILTSLGVDTTTEEALRKAVDDRQWSEWLRPIPPTVVLSQSHPNLLISIPGSLATAILDLAIEYEDGSRKEMRISLSDLSPVEHQRIHQQEFFRKKVSLGDGLPIGYHRISVSVAGELDAAARLIVCPAQAYQPGWLKDGKGAGIAVSLYGVRSGRNWGCGDATDLRGLIDWTSTLGAGFVALNPLHAIPNRQPYNTSPYLPTSIFFRNHIYLDLETIEDFARSTWAQRLFKSSTIQREIGALRASQYVEYERIELSETQVSQGTFPELSC